MDGDDGGASAIYLVGGGKIVKLHEVKHIVFDGCVEGVSRERKMTHAVAVYSRIPGWWVGDRVGY